MRPHLGQTSKTSAPASSTLVCLMALVGGVDGPVQKTACGTVAASQFPMSTCAGWPHAFDAIARARRQVVVGRLPKPHNSESLKSSISVQYLVITSCGTTRLRSGLGYGPAPAPGIPKAIDSRRVRCKSRRLRAPATHFPFSARRHGVTERNQDIGGSERLPAGRERTSNVRQLQSIGDGCKRDVATANTAARQVKVSASRAIFVRHLRNPPPRHT